jgi:hypothetical protein
LDGRARHAVRGDGFARGETRYAVFEGGGTESTWQIKDLNPNPPAGGAPTFWFRIRGFVRRNTEDGPFSSARRAS